MRVIATAGHVDHGKSTLIRALTGIDPDRLKEEKEREMTIDLGFAWLTLPSGEQVGIVDVPGHQDFVKNMLAGVGGIDAALFIVAANEGIMPQTREHLAILDLLRLPAGVIVLTKVDLVDGPEWLDLVKADVADTVHGTVMQAAPIVAVSAATGEGLPQLVATLDDILRQAPPRADRGRPRLPVDRVFTMAGHGTVVTGTLTGGTLLAGQELEILPSGTRTKVRGLQSHKLKVEEATPGSRVAANLTHVSVDKVRRGDVLTTPGWLQATSLVDARLEHLADAPRDLRHNQSVEFFCGTSQVAATVRLLGSRSLAPGETGWVQFRLGGPIAALKGDRFIVRQPSPSLTIGGGDILDPHPKGRHRRFRPDVIERLKTLAEGTPADQLLDILDRQGPTPAAEVAQIVAWPESETSKVVANLVAAGEVFPLPPSDPLNSPLATSKQVLVSRGGWQAVSSRVSSELSRYHATFPLRMGLTKEELKRRLKLDNKVFNLVLAQAMAQGEVVDNQGFLRQPDFQVRFAPQQQAAVENLLRRFEAAPFTTPSFKDVVADVGPELVQALVEARRLVRLGTDVLLLAETYQQMVGWVRATIAEKGSVNVAGVRDAFSTSRRYAQALLEHLDDQRITRRVGDDRVLR